MTDKTSVADWSTTADDNDNIAGITLGENKMKPSDVNGAIRTMMAQVASGVPLASAVTGLLPTANGGLANVTSIAAMQALDHTKNTVVQLVNGDASGIFLLMTGDFSAAVTIDTQNGVFVPLSSNPAGNLYCFVRIVADALYLTWFGGGASASASQNVTSINCMLAVCGVVGVYKAYLSFGVISINAKITIPAQTTLSGFGNSAGTTTAAGSTIVSIANNIVGFRFSDGSLLTDLDIEQTTGFTASGVEWGGSRCGPMRVSFYGLSGTAWAMDDQSANMNLWLMRDVRAISCFQAGTTGALIAGLTYTNGITLATGQIYNDPTSKLNWQVTSTGNGNVTASGTLAADVAANPTWWAAPTFPYGTPNTNAGYADNIEVSTCTNGWLFQNTYDNRVFGVSIQTTTNEGLNFQFGSSGNEVHGYFEASTPDIKFSAVVSQNLVYAGTISPPTITDSSTPGTNVVWTKQNGADGAATVNRYGPNNASVWNGSAGTGVVTYNTGRVDVVARSGAQTAIGFYTGSTGSGSITLDGAGTASFNTTSDYRLKSSVTALLSSGALLDALRPVEFIMGGVRRKGFLAHEFAEVFPLSVVGEKDAVDKAGEPVYQVMDASTPEVIAVLVAEVQDLRKRVAALEA